MIRQPAGQPRAAGAPGKAARPRPALHFAPRQGWMNDPNGLIQWNGRVHLFYQHNPSGPVWGNMTWGHASTTDLWTWEDHSLALEPDPAGPDRDGCFSGCAITRNGRPYLLYTGVNGRHQLPCLAEAASQDLTRWTRHDGNPVIAGPPPDQAVRAFRDHSAWWADSMWYQVVGGGLEDRGGALFLYRSADLRSWQYMGIFAAAADHGLDGMIWECPDVFALGDTVVVVVSVDDGQPRYAMWMTGEVAGHKFTPRVTGRCDAAHRYYAPQSLTLTDGRRIAIGWLQEHLDELDAADRSRVGVMSLPRELYLDTTSSLRSRPVRELRSARRETLITQLIEGRGTAEVTLSARSAHATEIRVTPVRGQATAIVVRLAGRGCEDVEVRVTADGVLITEGTRALTVAAPVPRSADYPARQLGHVTIYYDHGIVEVYGPLAGPAAVICNRHAVYAPIEVEVSARFDTPSCVASVTVWSCGRS
jgi:beta-fructofuranosidase